MTPHKSEGQSEVYPSRIDPVELHTHSESSAGAQVGGFSRKGTAENAKVESILPSKSSIGVNALFRAEL
ncbi:unnamed protein product [Rodentolepis nana]|uniref:Uncharacterized protein n=1 Tax=Rodentolepis nana TaxID=102285 RepID=A0A0R3THS1_RODNA|nr:unnamed protein product [Rodentolepis nana]